MFEVESIILAIFALILSLITTLTLTNIRDTDTGSAVRWINTFRSLPTLFTRQTWSTTVHIRLISIPDTIVAIGH